MKKILIVSTVSRQFFLFERANIDVLKSLGFEVHAAANFSDSNNRLDELEIVRHHFDIERSPFSLRNIKAYSQLKKIIKLEKFDVIHCHAPMGGVLTRIASKMVGVKKVIYTAHGLHFFKGAPLINWALYYPIERWLARYTDIFITINAEDYGRVNNTFKAKDIKYIPGVGIDTRKFKNVKIDIISKRKEIDVPKDAFVVLSIGELNKNKNHEIIMKAISKINNPNIYYVLCGQGPLENHLRDLAKDLGIDEKVKLLGYRNDIPEICKVADIFAFPSKREGLGLSALEAMASGLPVVSSNVHGIVDYSKDGKTGFSCNPKDVDGFVKAIKTLLENNDLRFEMGQNNILVVEKFDINNVKELMQGIYNQI